MTEISFKSLADDRLILSSRERLVATARRLVGAADAEDVAHDAFERALRARTVRSDGDPRPWLNRITRNVAYDTLRSRARRAALSVAPRDEESAERTVVRQETRTEIGAALDLISPLYRRTIELHDLQGYTNTEIAALEGVPYQTVRTRLFRARRALREQLLAAGA